jgi:outer membrane protein TolC
MAKMTTFQLRGSPPAWRGPAFSRWAILLIAAFLANTPAIAGDDQRSKNGEFHYQPYSETEIKAAVQKPLTLNDCIRIALAQNITLRIARGDRDRAAALHAGSYGKFLPVFSLDGRKKNTLVEAPDSISQIVDSRFDNDAAIIGRAQLFLPTGATVQFSSDFLRNGQIPLYQEDPGSLVPTTKKHNRAYAINFTQPLLRDAGPTVARSAFLSTGYDQQAEEKNLFNEKLQTVFVVKGAYYTALQRRELIKVNQTALMRDSLLVEASKALLIAKQASRRDVLSAEIRFADDKASLIASRSDYESALDKLKDAIGLPIDLPIALDSTGLGYTPVALDEQALIRQALMMNPLIHAAEFGISQSRLQKSVAKNALWPRLDLVASYSSNSEKDLISNSDLGRTGGWQASLNLSYSFLSREAAAKAEEADIALRQQQDRLLALQRKIMLDVRDIVRGVYSAAAEIEAIQAAIKVAEEKLEFATAMFNLGRASNFDITESQEFLLKAQNQYLRKVVDYQTQLALLESLIGKPITE